MRSSSHGVVTQPQTYDANNQLAYQAWRLEDTEYSECYTYSETTDLLSGHIPAVGSPRSYMSGLRVRPQANPRGERLLPAFL